MSLLTEIAEIAGKKGFRNWHGSPWDFDRFDFSKMGSGEGNQTFGWGGYTADSQGVGTAYRDQLKAKGDRYEHPQFGVVAPAKVEQYLASVARKVDPRRFGELKAKSTAQHILGSSQPVEEQIAAVSKGKYPDQQGWLAMLEHLAPFKRIENPGRLYEVQIAGDPKTDFLRNDLPFAMQSPKVQEALRDLRIEPWKGRNALGGAMDSGRVAYQQIAHKKGSERAASEALLDRDVHGIRYLDQGSRGVGVKTYNTITFSDKLISIVKKYGIASLLGSGVISQEMADELKRRGIDKNG